MTPPDVNTVAPTTSRTPSAPPTNSSSLQPSPGQSRRTSSVVGPPPVPYNSSLPNSPRPPNAGMADASANSAGPLRHPRPLTAAELHLELEKEQESIVNRLTRELSALRAQTASVASSASSTSDLFSSTQAMTEHPYTSSYGTGASIIPTSARRHRSSSNLSARSARSVREGVSNATTSISGVAAPRDRDTNHGASAQQSLDSSRPDTSRQNSYNMSHTPSNTGVFPSMNYRSTSATSPNTQNVSSSQGHAQRPSLGTPTHSHSHSRETSQGIILTPFTSNQDLGIGAEPHRSPSLSSAQAAARYETAATRRQELEAARKENEELKQHIKFLEKALAGQGIDPATIRT